MRERDLFSSLDIDQRPDFWSCRKSDFNWGGGGAFNVL